MKTDDIELSQENETCCICWEVIVCPPTNPLFSCNHFNLMHTDCAKNLQNCPLCREASIIHIDPINNEYEIRILCRFCIFLVTILTMLFVLY